MKQYQLKLYDKTMTYISTINTSKVISDIQFSNTMNWGQGNITLEIDADFDDTTYSLSDVVKIYVYDENNSWTLIYSWFVSKINRIQDTNSQNIELELIWIVWLLSKYQVSWTKNDEPATILKWLIDSFNADFWEAIFSYDWASVIDYGTSVNIELWNTDCFSAIKKIVALTNYYRYIWADGKLYFQPRPTAISHYFTNQRDVESIEVKENMENIVNSATIARVWWVEKTYTDAWSIATYGLKEYYEDKSSEILDETTQDEYWNNIIANNKNLKKETGISVNILYNIESILPWQIFKIRNFAYLVDDLQIVQTTYRKNSILLKVEKKTTFGDQVVGQF